MYFSLAKTFVYVIIFLFFFSNVNTYSSAKKILYSNKSISNYFSGLVSLRNNNSKLGLEYLNELRYLKNTHDQFNRELIFALVQEKKIPEVFSYLKKINEENANFFHANLLLGLNYYLEKDYEKSKIYFSSILDNKKYFDLEKLIAQLLLNYVKLFQDKSHDYKSELTTVPDNNRNLLLIHNAFLNCYLDNKDVEGSFLKLIDPKQLNFVRYNFFYANFLISKNRQKEALEIIENHIGILGNNILLDQANLWMKEGKINKISEIFNCSNSNHILSEFFYLIANLYSTQNDYLFSNFYLNLSLYLNPDFIFNNVLLGENYYFLEDYKNSKKIFSKFHYKNQIYSWYAKKKLTIIKIQTEDEKAAIDFLDKSFNSLKNPSLDHYYDLANFYKDFEKYEDSIEYYSKILNQIAKDHPLYPGILHRRGMSYERLKLWKKSEDDLIESLRLKPDMPHVLNYLAYSWLERDINLNKSVEMLRKANNKKSKDPYIIDSLGWGMYKIGKYHVAEKLLQEAVELMPGDPIVNDHYGDILWKLNKNLQANYFWNYVLNLESTENEMKEKIKKKLLFGIPNNS